MNHFSIQNHHGAPTFFKDGKPIFPLCFWQTEILDRDAEAFSNAGIEIYSFFRSIPHYDHPYWVGEGEYDFSRIDEAMREFHRKLPNAYCIPRIYVSAPDWWMKKNPDELCGFDTDVQRTRYEGMWQGSFRESFASEKWKQEMGEAFRQLIRHMKSADYADCIIGIHIANGITGEWHLWSPQLHPDTSICMAKRYGRPIPSYEERDADYWRCLHEATADAINHFAGIVKEESDFLTAVFYGYMPDITSIDGSWSISGDHRAAHIIHRLANIDILSAPHTYARRKVGQDGYFRSIAESAMLHGKLFIDEGDDRTCLDGRESNGVEYVGNRSTPRSYEASLQIIRREFGNMLTHNIGMWYMDLNGGNFHDDIFMEEIARLKRWGDHYMQLPRTRHAQVAVIASLESEFYLPPRMHEGNLTYAERYNGQIGELCKSGTPFDFYLSADLESEVMENYKVIFCLDGLALSAKERQRIKELQGNRRTFMWFHDTGAIVDGKRAYANTAELTGIEVGDTVPDTPVKREFADWTSIDLGDPVISAAMLRTIFKEAGVHIYLDSDDVFSAADSSLMIHAATDGDKQVTLPEARRITNIVTGDVMEKVQEFTIPMKFGETALFLLEKP